MRRPGHSRLVRLAVAVVTAAAATGLAACGSDDDNGPQTLDLTIGDLLPRGGELKDAAPAGKKAADLALEQINAAIDEHGADHSVELVHDDSGVDPKAAASGAEKLVADGASCLAGPWSTESVVAVAQKVAIPDSVLLISPAATGDELTGLDDDRLVNRTVPPESFDEEAPAEGEAATAFDELFADSDPKHVGRGPYDAQNFDAVILCYLAAVAAGSTDGAEMSETLGDVSSPPGDDFTWEQLPDAVGKLEDGDDIDYVGASGAIDLDKAGDPTAASPTGPNGD